MSGAPRIAALSGSLRAHGFNSMLRDAAVAQARALGADVDVVDLRALNLPIYDGDVEAAGLPASVVELRERIDKAQGFIIASPEYNSSIPGGLKNAIDWASRPPGQRFKEKWAALMGSTPGIFGTARMQPHLRQVLAFLGAHVLPTQVHIARAMEAFTPEGVLKDEARQKELAAQMASLVARLKG
ncbi:NAD(P)H-dependent oxidoreductase [Corallococcus sp. M34]|uniref:NADPH-dependent FMN reductase n=1 Tax=Citreicoccus inhibens TaxID=2849499 RepID=UPI001C241432|nr:NAD(P)H-dependent oxidoreductase [Citreicoccus inhibens]MBU8895554.1 NAD(P)H-dependent oxidoreductase [Citreicoccus inhibens]